MSSRNPPSAKSRSSSHRNGAPVRTHNKPVAPVPDGLVAAAPAAEERGVDINQLVHSFIEQTGVMDETLARDFLVAKSWNLPEAVTSYRQTFLSEGDQINHPASPLATSPVTSDNPWRKPPSLVSQNAGLKSQSTASNNNIDRDRHQFVRGLSKVYELRDGAESIKIDKDNLLNESSLPENGSSKHHLSTSISLDNSFMIPDLSELSEGLAEYIEHELIDFVTMNILEQTGHINWWAQHSLSRRLWPLHTNGDGNCLLHAASLAMWGVQDKFLQLRIKLDNRLKIEKTTGALYRRWRWQQTQSNMEMGLILSEKEWAKEWDDLIKLSSISKKIVELEDGQETVTVYSYEFLEEFHVYVLAQILKRPIIVFADSVLRDVDGYPLSPIPFGGVYLPLECSPAECYKTPLLLAYDRSHFTAVVTMATGKSKKEASAMRDIVPLTGPECDLLPMHFFVDPGKDVDWNNLPEDSSTMKSVINSVHNYLEIKNIPLDQIQSGRLCPDESHASTNSSTLRGRDSDKHKVNVMGKMMGKLKTSNHKSKDAKNSAHQEELELEPGNDLIMCAKLTINTPKSYSHDIEKYLKLTKEEYENKKHHGQLQNLKTLPKIATKDYAKSLLVQPQSLRSISPTPDAAGMCVMCCEFLGTAEHNNLCSSCFRQSGMGSQPSQLCKNCGQFNGTAEKHFYCSSCYEDFIQLKGGPDDSDARHEQQSTGSDSGNNSLDLSKYAVEMPEEDFVTRIPVSHNPQPPVPSLYHPFPVHAQDYTLGNPSLTNSYDRYLSGGYLHRVAEPPSQGGLSLGMDMPREHGSSSLHMVADSSGRSTRPHATLDTRQYTNRADNSRQHSGTDNTSRQHPKKSDYSRRQQGEYSQQQSGRGSYSKNYSNNHYHRDKSTKYSQSRYDSEDSGQYRQHPHPHSRTTWYASSTRDSRHGGGGGQNVCKRCQKLFPLQQGLCRICRAELSRPVTMNAVRSDVLSRCIRNGCNQSAASNKGLCSKCLSAERHHQPRSVNQKYTSMY